MTKNENRKDIKRGKKYKINKDIACISYENFSGWSKILEKGQQRKEEKYKSKIRPIINTKDYWTLSTYQEQLVVGRVLSIVEVVYIFSV